MSRVLATVFGHERLVGLRSRLIGGGYLTLRNGTQPAVPDDAITGSEMFRYTFSGSDYATPSSGSMPLVAYKVETAIIASTLTWARLIDSSGDTLIDFDIGNIGSGAGIELGKLTFAISDPLRMSKYNFIDPQSAT